MKGNIKMQKEKKKIKRRTYAQKQNVLGYTFMLPWIIGFLIFTLIPFFVTIYLSFTNVKSTILGYEIEWAGLKNYYTAFFVNTEFTPALLSFLAMIIPYTFVIIIVSFILAYLLNKIKVARGVMRTIYFLPVIIMSGPVMSQILDKADEEIILAQGGTDYSNVFIMQIIHSISPVVADFMSGIFDQLSMILWFTGIPIVLFISGLQKINPSLYEAAKIDMANEWQILWKITIPMIKPTALVATVFTIAQLGTYDVSDIYTLIKKTTSQIDVGLGYAATYSLIYSIIVLLIIGMAFLLFKERKDKRHNIW